MSSRKANDKFIDKFLGIFGITRPKKKKRVVSKRKDVGKKPVPKNDYAARIPLNDNFQIISENERTDNIKSNSNKSSKSINSNNKNKKSKDKEKKKRPVLRFFSRAFLVIMITICLVAGAGLMYFHFGIDGTVSDDLYNLKLEYTTILYAKDSDGNDVELTRLHGEQNRLWVDSKDIPKSVKNAFISCEDKRFKEHSGVDWKRTISAAANEVLGFYGNRQGGSTITQQLIKNITQDNEQNWQRKLREIKRALYIEERYDKDTILECYLNTIHLGNGVDGVEIAANYYFDKHISDISLTQAACLAAITNEPSTNNPYKNPETNKKRRNWVLDEMYNNGYISKTECENAKKADLGLRKNPSTVLSSIKTVKKEYNSFFVEEVIEDVCRDLAETKGWNEKEAREQLYKGGFKIYTTIDLDMQSKLDEVYNNEEYFTNNIYFEKGGSAQSGMTIMDYKGNIKAVAGCRGKKKGDAVTNFAREANSTGSAIKPISVYAPAVEYNVISWGSSIEDSPINVIEDGESKKWPKNYEGTYTYGNVSVLRALQKSLNTVPVRILDDLTIDTSYKFVTEKMGLAHFDATHDKNRSSLALGGSYKGATTQEMAAAFSTFGNGGIYYNPKTYSKILDQNNEVVIDNSDSKHRAVSEGTAGVMCKMLQTVATSGTGTPAQFGDWQIMCKTGTTTDYTDKWFVGGTPYYMAACWFGDANNKPMHYSGTNPAIVLWKAAMSSIHEDLESKEFTISDKTEYRKYCYYTGQRAKTGCPSVGYGYFKSDYPAFCSRHGGSETGVVDDSGYNNSGYYYSYDKTTSSNNGGTTEKTSETSQTGETSSGNADDGGGDDKTEATSAPPASEPKTNATQAGTTHKKQE